MTPNEIIALLDLTPHPEGGHYRETWRAPAADGRRAPGTAIYFLLRAGETSAWHRVDAAEMWHWYAGAPLELTTAHEGARSTRILGPDLETAARPQVLVPAHHWQTARSLGPCACPCPFPMRLCARNSEID